MTRGIASRPVRPAWRWYSLEVAVAVFGVLISIGSFAMGFTTALTGLKPALSVDSDGGVRPVRLIAGREYAVYISVNSAASCTATPSARVHLSPADHTFTYGSGNSTMKLAYQLSATATGRYGVECHEAPFAIGRQANFGPLVGGLGFVSVALLGPVCLSLLAPALIGVVRYRRHGHHDRPPWGADAGGGGN